MGEIGVDLFFVLSGFLITGILLDIRATAGIRGGLLHSLRNFYIRRALRLLPLLYLVVALGYFFKIPPFPQMWLWHATYLSNIYQWLHVYKGYGSNLWTLAVEQQFYLVWPVIILFVPRKLLLPVILILVAVAPACRYVVWAGGFNADPNRLPFSALDCLGIGGRDKGCGISAGKMKGATALGRHPFMGKERVWFYKTTPRFVIENGAPYYNPRSILIINDPDAKDVSTTKLKSFVENSSMAVRRYSPYSFICGDFASRVHNKAESSGIRCGFIMCNIWDVNKHESIGHAFNVFCGLDGKGNPVPIFVDMTQKSHTYLTEAMFKKYCSDISDMEIFV